MSILIQQALIQKKLWNEGRARNRNTFFSVGVRSPTCNRRVLPPDSKVCFSNILSNVSTTRSFRVSSSPDSVIVNHRRGTIALEAAGVAMAPVYGTDHRAGGIPRVTSSYIVAP